MIQYLLSIVLVLPALGMQQTTVTGVVTDAVDGLPVPRVEVFVAGQGGAITDQSGRYVLQLPGPMDADGAIRFEHPCFHSVAVSTLDVRDGVTVDVGLPARVVPDPRGNRSVECSAYGRR